MLPSPQGSQIILLWSISYNLTHANRSRLSAARTKLPMIPYLRDVCEWVWERERAVVCECVVVLVIGMKLVVVGRVVVVVVIVMKEFMVGEWVSDWKVLDGWVIDWRATACWLTWQWWYSLGRRSHINHVYNLINHIKRTTLTNIRFLPEVGQSASERLLILSIVEEALPYYSS